MKLKKLIEELQKSKEDLFGLEVYEMIGEGCLNGSWSNNHNSTYMNEIARKKEKENKTTFDGLYSISYIEPDGEAFIGTLEIRPQLDNVFNLKWNINYPDNFAFRGVGMQTGEKQLTVLFWQINL